MNLDKKWRQITGIKLYQELFMRRLDTWANEHADTNLGKFSDTELREMMDEICEKLRVECGLDQEAHLFLKGMVEGVLFKRGRKLW